ncbi:MAG: helix-turn-helix transcriptional regulator, partial [Planctomycetota bacterium]
MAKLLSPREIATRLGMSYDSVLRHIHAGNLPKRDLSTGNGKPRYRVSEEELESFIQGRTEHREPARRRRRR